MNDEQPQLNNKTLSLYEPHINYLDSKLEQIFNQLQTFEPERKKRGLIDGLGSVIKSISGNLDYTDAIKYENAIRVLSNNEQKLESEMNNHISLNKEWTLKNSKILENITLNQDKITKVLNLIMSSDSTRENELIKYAHLAQYFLILGDDIDRLSEEIYKLENTLAFIRVSGAPHSILNIVDFKAMLSKLRILYSKDEILDVEIRYFYDTIKLGYFYKNSQIVIVHKVPIASPMIYELYKLCIVPNKNRQILIPSLPFIATSGDDSKYIEAECPKVKDWYLCKQNSNYKTPDNSDCIHQLLITQELQPSCKLIQVTLRREAMEQLDDKHYVLSFPNKTKVKTSCGQEQYRTLEGSFLAIIPLDCYIKTPEFTISNSNDHIKGHPLKIIELPQLDEHTTENTPIVLNSINLENLHALNEKISLQNPIRIKEISDLSLYHTTIPLYVILSGAAALAIFLMYRPLQAGCVRVQQNPETNITTSEGIYTDITETRRCHPRELKVDHNIISSTLPNIASNSR